MKKILAALLAACLSMVMAACSRQEEVSAPPSQTELLSSENQSQSAFVSSSKAEKSKLPEAAFSSSETEAEVSSSAPDPVAPIENKIAVQPVSMTGEHKAFSITDNHVQDSVLGYFNRMQPCNPDPHTGGYVFEIDITDGDITGHYSLLSSTDANGSSYVVKDNQWYTADHNLWLSVVAYYPKFDYENNQPDYRIEIMNIPKNSGMGLSFYSNPLLVWSKAEQEKATSILAYIDAIQPINGSIDVADTEKNIVEIYIYENNNERKYLCYDLYDKNSKCFIKYEGVRVIEKGVVELPPYTKGGWFVANAGFYKYLNSLN